MTNPPSVSNEGLQSDPLKINQLRTGDLVFFSGDTPLEKGCRWLTRCGFSHVGMILVENGKVYVWESDIGQSYKPGPRLIPLLEKLARYKGNKILGYRPYTGTDISHTNFLSLIEKYQDKKFDEYMLGWYTNGYIQTKGIYCSKLISIMYNDLGVMNSNIIDTCPRDWWLLNVGWLGKQQVYTF